MLLFILHYGKICQPKQAKLGPTENEALAAFVFLAVRMETIRLPLTNEGGFGPLPT